MNTTHRTLTTITQNRNVTTQNLSHEHKVLLKLLSKKEKRSQTQEIEFLIEQHAEALGVEHA
jgi:hypothetical protein